MSTAILDVHRAVLAAFAQFRPATFGLACSGGADSLVLADAARQVLGAAAVVVMHVDHGLAQDSPRVAADVVAWANAHGMVAVVRRVEVARRASLEQAARIARYRALDDLADELGVAAIATAHTARDQAETVVMRLLRGTGVAGLAAIAGQRGRYLRPLLRIDRATIDAYAHARSLPTWDDPMNADLRFFRGRVRHRLMPQLVVENPSIEDALCRLARNAAEWMDAIDQLAEPLSHRLLSSELAAVPAAVRKRAFALALTRRGLGFDAAHLDALDRLMAGPARGTFEVAVSGARAIREYDRLSFVTSQDLDQREDPGLPERVADPQRFSVRPPAPGDRMRPARLRGRSRKLSDLFVDAKVPRRLRASARVACRRRDGVIVWVEHLGFAFDETDDEEAPTSPDLE
jgi:tRNA(Ile)-lysidine synthetase-like protein